MRTRSLVGIAAGIAVVVFCIGCAQVQEDGARTLENANEVVSSAGGKVWTGTPKDNGTAPAPKATETKKKK